MIRAMFLGASALALTACSSTTSFAPPRVTVKYNNPATATNCSNNPNFDTEVRVDRNVQGAFVMLAALSSAYECAAHAAANGRQKFEVPAFVSTTAAATAVAFGGGATYGILGQTGNAVFNAGKGYYDPKAKAGIYNDALEALECIKSEAMGIEWTKIQAAAAQTGGSGQGVVPAAGPLGKISLPVEEQYYVLIETKAKSVSNILRHRLNNAGAELDGAAIAARIKEIAAEIKAAEDAKKTPPPAPALMGVGPMEVMAVRNQQMIELDLAVLRPRLDQCVLHTQS